MIGRHAGFMSSVTEFKPYEDWLTPAKAITHTHTHKVQSPAKGGQHGEEQLVIWV